MKEKIIYLIIYGIAVLLMAVISSIHQFSTSELFIILIVLIMNNGMKQIKENEKLKNEIKMLESRIDTLRDRINGTNFNS